ncbi:MAG: mechanosensitive ion channel [Clostridia bacterium]|nr:mechanosensitive ion channel [Clostridia bacterium]
MNWQAILDHLVELATTWGIRLLAAIVVLVIALKIINWIKKFIKTSPKLDKLDPSLRSFLSSFTSIMLYVLLVIVIAGMIGIPATSFITILASCGVAVGLALQGSLSNFAGGLMILFFKPFKVGDFIEVCGETGTVAEISVVYTVLLSTDNKRITLPNGTITNSVIENYSAEDLRRVDLTINTAYTCDMEKVKAIVTSLAEQHPMALAEPAPQVRVSQHADSSLTYVVRVWCKNADYWDLYFDLTEGIKKAFDENGIQIPYPQMDVHVKQ